MVMFRKLAAHRLARRAKQDTDSRAASPPRHRKSPGPAFHSRPRVR